jgi:hypothetical protein
MRIPLKDGWEKEVKKHAKVYPVGPRDKEFIDNEFDKLHDQGRMGWAQGHTMLGPYLQPPAAGAAASTTTTTPPNTLSSQAWIAGLPGATS